MWTPAYLDFPFSLPCRCLSANGRKRCTKWGATICSVLFCPTPKLLSVALFPEIAPRIFLAERLCKHFPLVGNEHAPGQDLEENKACP